MNTVVIRRPNYVQIKLDSGERILVSVAQSGIAISRLVLGGLLPFGTIWEWSRKDVGALEAALVHFAAGTGPTSNSVADKVANVLMEHCRSVRDVKRYCSQLHPVG